LLQRCDNVPCRRVQLSSLPARFHPAAEPLGNFNMSVRSTIRALGHNAQADNLREQLRGLLPDSVKPGAEAAAQEAGDGMRKLLDYATLVAQYREPIAALLRRLAGRAPAAAAPVAKPSRRFPWRPVAAVALIVGVGALVYGMSRPSRGPARHA